MKKRLYHSMGLFIGLAYIFAAGPGAVMLHALDHVADSHVCHLNEYGLHFDRDHHDADHDHEMIFSALMLPASVRQLTFRVSAPESRLFDVFLLLGSGPNLCGDLRQHTSRADDLTFLSSSSTLPASFINRGPPLS